MVKKALLIGINYKGSDAQLNGCINDIKNINTFITNHCDYSPSNVRIVTEENTLRPTRNTIETQIAWLVSNAAAGDTLFFYYSGHGSNVKDATADETDGKDEVIVPLDYTKSGVITDDWLMKNMILKVPNGTTLWGFTDCCHSGTMLDLKYNYRSQCTYTAGTLRTKIPYNPNEWSNQFLLSLEKGIDVPGTVCLFSGCQDSETSADATINNMAQGAFSFCFLEFLKNNVVKMPDGSTKFKSKTIKMRNILKEVNARLDINGFTGQNSQLSIGKVGDLDITFNP